MAYIGSTASSSVANPPRHLAPIDSARVGSTLTPLAARLWVYASTGTSTDPFTAGYFTDGYQLGMKSGDVVICVGQTSSVASSQWLGIGVVSSVSTTGGGTQLSTFSFISST